MTQFFPSLEQIHKLTVTPEPGELCLLNFLHNNLPDNYEVYFQPFLNGDNPNVIIKRKDGGVMIIEVKDWLLDNYYIDEREKWRLKSNGAFIKSPMSQVWKYKENLYYLHIEQLLKQQIHNPKLWALVSCVVYFHNQTVNSITKFCNNYPKMTEGYIKLIGTDSLTNQKFFNLISKLRLSKKSYYFSTELYNSFKRYLQPARHTIEQGEYLPYRKKQKTLAISKNGAQKIIGVAGSGKTRLLAKRAVNAHMRTSSKVLILTFNITLRNYIHDEISKARENFGWEAFYITHYHQLYVATANNHNLVFDNFLVDSDNEQFFVDVKNEITKYDAIFIDEIQDYKPEWIKIIKKYFLSNDGEFVVFGDEKQNVYHRQMDKDKMPNTGIVGQWNKLNESHRLTTKIVNFIQKLQFHLFNGKYTADTIKLMNQFTIFDLQENIDYIFLNPATSINEIYEKIMSKIIELNAQPNDVAILATKIAFLRELEFIYRQKTHEKTSIMFETKETHKQLEKKLSGNALVKKVEKIRQGLKFNFWANAGIVKFSTIHSFKGWESSTLFLIIENMDNLGDARATNEELFYTGITRCRSIVVDIIDGSKIIPILHKNFHQR